VVASPGLPTAVEGFDVERLVAAVGAVPEGAAGPGAGYPAEGAAVGGRHRRPSSPVEHFAVGPCGREQLPPLLGSVGAYPGFQPSLPPLGVPCPPVDPDPVDCEGEEASSPQPLVSAEPSSSERRLPVGSSWQFLLLPVEGQTDAAVTGKAGPGAGWEAVGPQRFQASSRHQAAAGGALKSRGLVYPGIDVLGRSLGVCWHLEADCWGAVEAWSLLHFAAGPEKASAADVRESSSSPQAHLLHLPSAGTVGEEGVEDVAAYHLVGACHLAAAAAAELQIQGPFLALGLEAWSESGSVVLGVVFHQKLGYWVPWSHCSPGMEVLPQVLPVALRLSAPPSACWPSSSSTSGPAGAGAAAAAAGAFVLCSGRTGRGICSPDSVWRGSSTAQ